LYSSLKFIMIEIFVCIHIVGAGVSVDFNIVDEFGVNLRPEDLSVMFDIFKVDYICYFSFSHLILLFY
jgi:hypothetical protein